METARCALGAFLIGVLFMGALTSPVWLMGFSSTRAIRNSNQRAQKTLLPSSITGSRVLLQSPSSAMNNASGSQLLG